MEQNHHQGGNAATDGTTGNSTVIDGTTSHTKDGNTKIISKMTPEDSTASITASNNSHLEVDGTTRHKSPLEDSTIRERNMKNNSRKFNLNFKNL